MDWAASSPSSYYPQHPSYPYSTERIADLCLLKLQHASSGRTHSLLRQVQLTCMLHRIRMQAFLRPAMAGYHPHYQQQQQQQRYGQRYEQGHLDLGDDSTSDSDLSSDPSSSPTVVSAPALSSQSTYDWDLDMLLSMSTASPPPSLSASSTSVPVSSDSTVSSSPTDDPDQTMFALSQHLHQQQQQQHHMSSIPMVPYTSEYASEESSSPSIEALQQSLDHSPHTTSIALSSIPPSLSAPSDLAQQQQQQHQQQSYYELLMAANPNEPLSQLMSTTAATIASSSFTAPASISTPPAPPSSLEHSSPYSLLNGSIPRASTVSTADMPRAEDVLTSVATTFVLSNYATAGPAVTSDALGSIPLTTREIMDALSGQFPIQQPQTLPSSMYSSQHAAQNSVTTDTAVDAIDSVEQTSDSEEWQGDSDMMSPPAQSYHHQQEGPMEPAIGTVDSVRDEQESNSRMESQEQDQDQEMEDMGCMSPPLSPTSSIRARRISMSPRSKRLSRSTARRQSDSSESVDHSLADSCATIESVPSTEDPVGNHKRRRLNVEEGSTSPCSSPESSPPSPKTPPPQSEIPSAVQGQPLSEDPDQQAREEDLDHEKRLKSELSEVAQVALLVEDVVDSLKSMAPTTANLMEAEDAGVLSPSLLARYPKRQSTRLLRRSHGPMPSNNCSPQDNEAHLLSTGKVSAA